MDGRHNGAVERTYRPSGGPQLGSPEPGRHPHTGLPDPRMALLDDKAPKDLIGFLDYYLVKKAPFQLPDGVRMAIVKFAPWIAVVLLLLALPVLLVALGLSMAILPAAAAAGATPAAGLGLTTIVVVVELVLDVMALPGLFARRMSGWRLIFYARLIAIVAALLRGAIIGAIVGGVIGLYILFQIRPLYAGAAAAEPTAA
jgi:hypothetical protein